MSAELGGGLARMGDDGLVVWLGELGPSAFSAALAVSCRAMGLKAEVVAGEGTALVRLAGQARMCCPDPQQMELLEVACLEALASRPAAGSALGEPEVVEIPVLYDGPDLQEVARECSMEVSEVVRRHQQSPHVVDFMGFAPGFGYLGGLDPALRVARLASPRPRVFPGAVGIAAGRSCIYPTASPGGWRIIARTDAVLFDPRKQKPTLLSPGTKVHFRAVEHLAGKPKGSRHVTKTPKTSPAISVTDASGMLTVQDAGRFGWAAVGVARAGALDWFAAAMANRLVGNPEDRASLELVMGSLTLTAHRDVVVSLTGAPRPARLMEEGRGFPLPHGCGFVLRRGQHLRLGAPEAGIVSYVAFGGGIAAELVMGSRSRDTMAGIGPAPLAAGSSFALGKPSGLVRPGRWLRREALPPGYPGATRSQAPLRLVGFGMRDTGAIVDAMAASSWEVASDSDRAGMRLWRPEGGVGGGGETAPVGVAEGVVQLPEGGMPIILRANHATTGGYKVVARLCGADLAVASQLRPGDAVALGAIDPAEAEVACRVARLERLHAVVDLGEL